jgi:activating signal cointegrator 1
MKAITLLQPYASLCVQLNPCSDPYCPCQDGDACHYVAVGSSPASDPARKPFKWIETRSWKAPDSLIGQRIAIHAAKKMPPSWLHLGKSGIRVQGFGRTGCALVGPGLPEFRSTPRLEGLLLPFGKVVGTAVLAGCVPIGQLGYSSSYVADLEDEGPLDHQRGGLWLIGVNPETHGTPTRIEDQRPFGDFSPGRWAWLLTDVERFEEPIPATGRQRIWDWSPVQKEGRI